VPNSAPAKLTPRKASPTIGAELEELDTLEELEDLTLEEELTELLTTLELTTLDFDELLDELLEATSDDDEPAPTIP
jgi:hypothetical protein